MFSTVKLYAIIGGLVVILGLIYYGVNHYENLVEKANRAEAAEQALNDERELTASLRRAEQRREDAIRDRGAHESRLREENLALRGELDALAKDPETKHYLDQPVPDPVRSLLCKHIGAYKDRATCSNAAGDKPAASPTPERVRGQVK